MSNMGGSSIVTAPPSSDQASARAAMLAAAAMIAVQIAGKATRDGLFLSVFPVTVLPAMLVGAGILSAAVALAWGRLLRTNGPARLVPAAFVASATLFVADWVVTLANPRVGAVATYGLVTVTGPILISSFWSLVNERFDPRAAKRTVNRIGATATLGGVVGGILAERLTSTLGVESTLPALAVLQLLCAQAARGVSPNTPPVAPVRAEPLFSGVRTLVQSPYLLSMAALVALSAVAAALIDYLFKAAATDLHQGEEALVRLFSIVHMGAALLTFGVQSLFGHHFIERFGIARTAAMLPAAIGVGGVAGLAAPGFATATAVWGTDHILRSSAFRSAHELLFTPIPAHEKRATKTLVDVASSRLGDIVGGALAALLLAAGGASAHAGMWWACIVLGLTGTLIAVRLHRGYVATLERNLLAGAVPTPEVEDEATRAVVMKAQAIRIPVDATAGDSSMRLVQSDPRGPDHDLPVPADLPMAARIAQLVPMLGDERRASDAMRALRPLAGTAIGQLGDVLLDPGQPAVVRRRIARLLGATGSRRAIDALLLALENAPFDVRYACGIALDRIRSDAPDIVFDRDRVFAAVHREVDVERNVWVAQAAHAVTREEGPSSPVGDYLRQRASASLENVFNLLSLVLPQRPLQIAFRGLQGEDRMLRGMGLEYLESVLPPPIRDRLWEFLEEDPRRAPTQRGRNEVVADLLSSHESIRIRIDEIQKDWPKSSAPDSAS